MDRMVLVLLFWVPLAFSSNLCNNCTKKELWVGAFSTVDTSGGGWNSAGAIPAIEMAVEDVNNNSSILTNYSLRMSWRDTKCNRGYGVRQLVDFIQLPRDKAPIMLIGGGCSVGTEATAEASHYWNLVQIAYSANSMALSDSKMYPLLYRTCYSESIGNPARIALLKKYEWTKVATMVQNEGLFTLVNYY
ncbi:gamma-aminobutyric acid type B receptor subunit 1-like [Actinia tenebrosa]|uniref:Gamma-aminobutyric acid type B receptor subunit 1-like n=1 Tax=Actinia tenebrosa TaxID=6105 RepID=A0A6P8H756_ACTTE|nr:gamma-aminobutyric acid type B receptor subunit 1-like [Actinia tenebrosa]